MSRFPRLLSTGHFPQFSAAFGLILSACSTAPCVPSVQVQKEMVPVPTACINKADVPAEPGPITLTGDARNDDALLAAKLAAVRVWGRTLVAMLGPCSKP